MWSKRTAVGKEKVAKLVDDIYSVKIQNAMFGLWQHMACVVIPEKPMEGILPVPQTNFYCELCRLTRADPFI
ncbi:putative E3 SUMO-protein ligase SIZ1, plant [Helianthus annuus]|nr:putative E3 SUMO-protein ligase SIZ1, plant [Helianthus annuus]